MFGSEFRIAWRMMRGQAGKVWLFAFCLALGVSLRSGMTSFLKHVEKSLSLSARDLLGGEMEIYSYSPLTEGQEHDLISNLPKDSRTQKLASFLTMAVSEKNSRTRLVEAQAVEEKFPYYGKVETSGPGFKRLFEAPPCVYVQPALLTQLDIGIGDSLKLGKTNFNIAGIILKEPGLGVTAFSPGPKIYIAYKNLNKTGLIEVGSHILYSTLVSLKNIALTESSTERLRTEWKLPKERPFFYQSSGTAIHVKTYRDKQADLERSFDRFSNYLRALSLITLLLSGIGIGFVMRSFVTDQQESLAILRILGFESHRLSGIIAAQAFILSLLGGALGMLFGAFTENFFRILLAKTMNLHIEMIPDFPSAAYAILLGVGVSLIFAALPVLEARSIKPMDLFKKETGAMNHPLSPWVLMLAGSGLFYIIAFFDCHSLIFAAELTGALIGGGMILFILGKILTNRLPGLFRGISGLRWETKYGIIHLGRTSSQSNWVIVSTGLCLLFLGVILLYENSVKSELMPENEAGSRSQYFLIDIQDSQMEKIMDFFHRHGISRFQLSPMVKARYTGLNGKTRERSTAFTTEQEKDEQMRHREQNLSFRDRLGEDEAVVQGKWMGSSNMPECSLEEWFAKRLNAKMGDEISFDVQGVKINARVTSIRRIRWSGFHPNFFVLISPYLLKGAPKTWVGSVAGLDEKSSSAFQKDLAEQFPNVTILDVAEAAGKVLKILDSFCKAMEILALFSLTCGLAILSGMIASTLSSRKKEAALLKALGATRKMIRQSFLMEFFILSMCSVLLGVSCSILAGWALIQKAFEIPLTPPWAQISAVGLAVLLLFTGIPLIICRNALKSKPMQVLRENAA